MHHAWLSEWCLPVSTAENQVCERQLGRKAQGKPSSRRLLVPPAPDFFFPVLGKTWVEVPKPLSIRSKWIRKLVMLSWCSTLGKRNRPHKPRRFLQEALGSCNAERRSRQCSSLWELCVRHLPWCWRRCCRSCSWTFDGQWILMSYLLNDGKVFDAHARIFGRFSVWQHQLVCNRVTVHSKFWQQRRY